VPISPWGGSIGFNRPFQARIIDAVEKRCRSRGTTIVITSGELCKKIRFGHSWTQACFEAMQAEVKPGDVILVSTGVAEMTIRYRLPRLASRASG
jgi:hypothetical protein